MDSYILTPKAQQLFKDYQYRGSNSSLTYSLIWSPLAEKLLLLTPPSLAPNAITLIALLLLLLTHLFFLWGHTSGQQLPPWRLGLMAASILIYQTLDNLDGKQARKTNSSSALGMLFDHGCDSVSSFLISLQVMEILQITCGTQKVVMLGSMVMLTYFSAIWAQYSTGAFQLGVINPVDEGLPAYALFALFSIFIPHCLWNQQHLFATYNQEVTCLLFLLLPPLIFFIVRHNYRDRIRSVQDINRALWLPLSYGVGLLALGLWGQSKQTDSSSLSNFDVGYWPISYCLMFSWSRNMILMQLCAVTDQPFRPFNIGSLTFLLPALISPFLSHLSSTSLLVYFWVMATLSALVFLHFCISLAWQGAQLLNIKLFSLEKPHRT